MTSRRFAPLFWCQFFSAFNDNFLKNALVFLILYKVAGSDAEALVTLAGAVFIAPFFLLSGIGGELADRYDMAVIARRLKQRARRGRNLLRDPDRHHRWRICRGRRGRPRLVRRPAYRLRRAVLGREPHDPEDRRGRAGSAR